MPIGLHEDRLFSSDPSQRVVARQIYAETRNLPLVSPHGHVDPKMLAEDKPFADPVSLLVAPDHYITRMLTSQGISPQQLGVPDLEGRVTADPRDAWRTFCQNFYLFRGTPSRGWLEQELVEVFDIDVSLGPDTADETFDLITARLATPEFRPRALFDRFGIEVLATTESPVDTLEHHATLDSLDGWKGRVISTFRPDDVFDADRPDWRDKVARLGEITGEDTATLAGYLDALRRRRDDFKQAGATATDHGHPSARTLVLDTGQAQRLFGRLISGRPESGDAEAFRAYMLVESARMSIEDGLVMQLHPGTARNHDRWLYERFGRDVGGDIPQPTNYVQGLAPLLDELGHDERFRLVLFTLDESTYSRELAPLAGVYPSLFLGPAWWFYDSPDGMRRYRELTTETAGFYNTAGFTDDTRAFPSIPVRHDVSRRVDAAYLARLVAEHRLPLDEAIETAADLAYHLPKRVYRLSEGPRI